MVQLPYNWLMWNIRVVINMLVVSGNALAMIGLFSLTLYSFGGNVAVQVRVIFLHMPWLQIVVDDYRISFCGSRKPIQLGIIFLSQFQIGSDPLVAFWVAFMAGLLYTVTPFILSFMHSSSAW